jgi:hypothetical protein
LPRHAPSDHHAPPAHPLPLRTASAPCASSSQPAVGTSGSAKRVEGGGTPPRGIFRGSKGRRAGVDQLRANQRQARFEGGADARVRAGKPSPRAAPSRRHTPRPRARRATRFQPPPPAPRAPPHGAAPRRRGARQHTALARAGGVRHAGGGPNAGRSAGEKREGEHGDARTAATRRRTRRPPALPHPFRLRPRMRVRLPLRPTPTTRPRRRPPPPARPRPPRAPPSCGRSWPRRPPRRPTARPPTR